MHRNPMVLAVKSCLYNPLELMVRVSGPFQAPPLATLYSCLFRVLNGGGSLSDVHSMTLPRMSAIPIPFDGA